MSSNFLVTQGSAKDILLILKNYQNVTVTDYTGGEGLSTEIWAGGPTPTLISPETVWDDASAGKVVIRISADDTATLYAGTYEGVCRVDDGTVKPDLFNFTLTVTNGPDGVGGVPDSSVITRLAVETELVDRDSALLILCKKSTVADGNNRFLSGPIGAACTLLGVTPATPGKVTDDDLANVPAGRFYLLCDLAEYRLIKSLLMSIAQPDQTSGNTKIQIDTMMQRFRQQMLDLYKQYKAYLGNAESTLVVGSLRVRPATCWGGESGGTACDY